MSESGGPVIQDVVCSDEIRDCGVEGMRRYYAVDDSGTIRDSIRCVKRTLKENLKGNRPVHDYTRL